MPHLTLEYSDNLPGPVDFEALLARLHATLAEAGSAPLAQIKSRAVPCRIFRVGAGSAESVFVHLTVALLAGRDLERRRAIAERLLAVLRETFACVWAERPCDLTVDVREMERETYAKAMNDRARGAASPPA